MDNSPMIISQCLHDLGLKLLAKHASQTQSHQVLQGYAKVAEHKAIKMNRSDVLEVLYFGGFTYA